MSIEAAVPLLAFGALSGAASMWVYRRVKMRRLPRYSSEPPAPVEDTLIGVTRGAAHAQSCAACGTSTRNLIHRRSGVFCFEHGTAASGDTHNEAVA